MVRGSVRSALKAATRRTRASGERDGAPGELAVDLWWWATRPACERPKSIRPRPVSSSSRLTPKLPAAARTAHPSQFLANEIFLCLSRARRWWCMHEDGLGTRGRSHKIQWCARSCRTGRICSEALATGLVARPSRIRGPEKNHRREEINARVPARRGGPAANVRRAGQARRPS